jgi:putative ABC transport system permease protein
MFHATRALARSPGYVAIALITLALGIGLNTSMFSAVTALLFRGAPFPRADQLIQIVGDTRTGPRREFSEIELREIGEQTTAFSSHTVIGRASFAVSEAGRTSERVAGAGVSGDLFATFGVQPIRGRTFTAEEMKPGGNDVVVLSHTMWRERYGGADDIVGHTFRLDGQVVTVVGVMPADFEYPQFWGAARLWRPLSFTADQLTYRDYRAFELIGRLENGMPASRAERELAALAQAQERAHPDTYAGWRYRAVPLHRVNVDDLNRRMSWMLLGLSGFVLLIACANLAGLQLARATARVRALAVRAALGASRGRLVREQLAESIVLSLAGGVLGLLVAF